MISSGVKSTCCFACCTNNYESLLSIAYAIFGELGCLFDKTRDYVYDVNSSVAIVVNIAEL